MVFSDAGDNLPRLLSLKCSLLPCSPPQVVWQAPVCKIPTSLTDQPFARLLRQHPLSYRLNGLFDFQPFLFTVVEQRGGLIRRRSSCCCSLAHAAVSAGARRRALA